MALRDETIMILGGSGLVGHAMARRLLEFGPKTLVLVALTEREVHEAAAALEPYRGVRTTIVTEFGNVYVPASLARLPRTELVDHGEHRRLLLDDIFGDLTDERLARSFLVQLLEKHRPDRLLDSINTATAFAYLDQYTSAKDLLKAGAANAASIERHLLTLPTPQLTRHMQILVEGLKRAGTRTYVKIGTSGTGGMGFNIPYTHSEERPSRTLLTKSAVAGAHTLLLFLMGRTPGAPATIEIKPTAAIGWREIAYGTVRRGGNEITRSDCPRPLALADAFDGRERWTKLEKPLEAVYINMGENGLFANEEFATITALGQMEFITPEEIADYVVMEIEGHPTGRDVIAGLDSATAGPTYRAGLLRGAAMRRLQQLEQSSGTRSIAFEMLGPPRLTKILFEGHLLSRLCDTLQHLSEAAPAALVTAGERLLDEDGELRAEILSVGIPILSHDGTIRRGAHVVVPPAADGDPLAAAARGWVDLREANFALWVSRAKQIVTQAQARARAAAGTGSDEAWDAMEPTDAIKPWRLATWIFRTEDRGERIKR